MKLLVAAALAVCILSPAMALAQDADDDWEYVEDAAKGLAAAVSRYDTGHAIVVQCRSGELSVVVQGLELGEGRRQIDIARADGRRDRQPWRVAGPTAAGADIPARAARLLRGGGAVQFRTHEGTPAARLGLELPSQSANIDRVLTACGRPLEDERDAFPVFAGEPDRRSLTRALNRRDLRTPGTEAAAAAEITCIVGEDLLLRDCLVQQALPLGSLYGIEMAERMTGVLVVPAEGQSAPGTVYHQAGTNMLVVVEDVVVE